MGQAAMKYDEETGNSDGGELVVVGGNYAIMKPETAGFIQTIQENLGEGQKIDMNMFDRIKTPSAGNTTWTIPSISGEVETKELEGIVVFSSLARAYWEIAYDDSGGGSPPDCRSDDCVIGTGMPGGACLSCPLNVFGTASKGGGKACQEQRVTFLVTPDSPLPKVILVKPGSLKEMTKYLLGLGAQNKPVHRVVTKLTLTKEKNKNGIDFSRINFQLVGDVDNVEAVDTYVNNMRPFLQQQAGTFVDNG